MLGRILGFAFGAVLFLLALVFASVLALVAGVAVIAVWAYLSWRAWMLARQAPPPAARPGSVVIEGEYRVERDAGAGDARDAPSNVERDSGRDDVR
ncbi:MAG: hypothetical protein IT515_00140 [Burkholderiales bacterium]|nr:hypothetical protein [Burkholderiales bacterium]